MAELLTRVKTALRIKGNAYDLELSELIHAALIDMSIANVPDADINDPIIRLAVVTYCKLNFGNPDNYDKLKKSYDEQKAQLGMSFDYGGANK